MRASFRQAVLVAVCVVLWFSPSRAAGETLAGIADLIGADTFYSQGYTGTRAILGNVEGGMVWDGHQTLDDGRVAQRVRFAAPPLLESSHPTWVGGVMVADALLNDSSPTATGPGIAYGSTLWSGQIATSISGNSFSISGNSLLWPLMMFGEVGIGGQTVDVINSSWSADNDTGNSVINALYDYLANSHGVTMVISSGNYGQGDDTVGAPANSWNVITVGATDSTVEEEAVTSFSSGGDIGSFGIPGTRTKPDIVAPGLSIVMPTYPGSTSFIVASGTSFAAPVVAASAGLMIDLGKDTGRSTDPRVIKATLLNSATKLDGWQQQVATHPTTGTQINFTPVDPAQGTGRVDLGAAWGQYTASTGGAGDSGSVSSVGWSLAQVQDGSPADYFIDEMLSGGSKLTATLVWFMDRSVIGFDPGATDPWGGTTFWNDSFDDLDLLLYRADAGGNAIGQPIAASISNWDPGEPDDDPLGLDSVEHLHFTLPENGRYLMRVRWTQELFDYVADPQSETFALAWSSQFLPPGPLGDVNGDGNFDALDVTPFVASLLNDEQEFDLLYPDWNYWAADMNEDGNVDTLDITSFSLGLLGGGSPTAVPEPGALATLAAGLLSFVRRRH